MKQKQASNTEFEVRGWESLPSVWSCSYTVTLCRDGGKKVKVGRLLEISGNRRREDCGSVTKRKYTAAVSKETIVLTATSRSQEVHSQGCNNIKRNMLAAKCAYV
jgi:hypothetical protein